MVICRAISPRTWLGSAEVRAIDLSVMFELTTFEQALGFGVDAARRYFCSGAVGQWDSSGCMGASDEFCTPVPADVTV
jgi:hypothetical protein